MKGALWWRGRKEADPPSQLDRRLQPSPWDLIRLLGPLSALFLLVLLFLLFLSFAVPFDKLRPPPLRSV